MQYIYQYGLSSVSQLSWEKGKLIPQMFSRIWSHPSFVLPPVISSRSCMFPRELETVGVKREEVTPHETEKSLAPFDG